jgi:hypothetical protein
MAKNAETEIVNRAFFLEEQMDARRHVCMLRANVWTELSLKLFVHGSTTYHL